jgi:N-dimethylarginine dimethylaminohydrolase
MTRHVLMCEPLHFRIAYEINPWMRRANAVDGPRALEQWRGLRDALERLGVTVDLVEQRPEVPDMTFTANAGVVAGGRFYPANFRYAERRLEERYFIDWFEERGYEVYSIHEPHYWEGEGDVLPTPGGGPLFSGYRFRTELGAIEHLEGALGRPTVRLQLADPYFYHLDTCLCPLGDGRALYYPPAFTREGIDALREVLDEPIAVEEGDARRFACNAVVVDGGSVVLNTGCDATARALKHRGFTPVATSTDEFIKAGGSVKCLLLQLDAFEA